MPYTVTVYVWSAVGSTPLTGRRGAYCDLLDTLTIEADDMEQAQARAIENARKVEHAARIYWEAPDFPNHNTNSNWKTL